MKKLNDAVAYVAEDETLSPSFRSLVDFQLIILVGLTGVGKSTVVESLRQSLDFTLLPNRREITNEIIISSLQQADGETPYIVDDRVKRFEYTARYRAQHAGGMAYALSRLAINAQKTASLLIFDGLRGLNEVQHAATYFPKAQFIVLDAPDAVRLSRLLKRADSFDSTSLDTTLADKNLIADLQAIPNISAIFNDEQLFQIARSTRAADYSIDEVVKKTSIIVEERRNYDPATARVFLSHKLPPEQVLVIGTATQSPDEVTARVEKWVKKGG